MTQVELWWVEREGYFRLTWPQRIKMKQMCEFTQLTSLISGTGAPNSLLLILSTFYVYNFLLSEAINKLCIDIHLKFISWILSGLVLQRDRKKQFRAELYNAYRDAGTRNDEKLKGTLTICKYPSTRNRAVYTYCIYKLA